MARAFRLAILLLLTLPLASCRTGSQETMSTPASGASLVADIEALHEHLRRYDEAVNAGDIDALMALWTDDAVMIPPEGDMIEGKPACRATIGAMFELYVAEVHTQVEDVLVSGDLATVRLHYVGTSTPKSGDGESSTITGDGLYVFQRKVAANESGLRGWRIALEIWTAVPLQATD